MSTSNTPKNIQLKYAIKFANRGVPVVPLYSTQNGKCTCGKATCENSAGKHPMTTNGNKNATTDIKQIRQWWRDYPDANVGIVTVKKSNLIILDIDPRNGGYKTLKRLKRELGTLPATVTVITGGKGKHYYFKYPQGISSTVSKLGDGVEVLAGGKIAVVPPSKHKSGNRYQFKKGLGYDEIKLATLPEAWIQALTKNPLPPSGEQNAISPEKEKPLPSGQDPRNFALFSLAGLLHSRNASKETILAALLKENETKNSPPLAQSEVESIVQNILKYPDGEQQDKASDDQAHEIALRLLQDKYENGNTLLFADSGEFYHFDKTHWKKIKERRIKQELLNIIIRLSNKQRQSGSKKSYHSLNGEALELLKNLKADVDMRLSPPEWEDPLPVINCRNGEIWLQKDGQHDFLPHNRESYQLYCLPYDYAPDATCPKYDQALLDIFRDTEHPLAMQRHFNELVGYFVQPRRHLPLILILRGEGNNGKTILMKTVQKLMGKDMAYSCTHIAEIPKNRFAIGELLGKRLLIDDDVAQGTKLPDGFLKKISEAKSLTGENKYGAHFNFTCRSLPVLLCNNVPSIADISKGFKRRLMVIPFDRSFDKDNDDDLFPTIWEQEMSGVLNRALEGIRRLFERGDFKKPSSVRNASKKLMEAGNPLLTYIKEHYTVDLKAKRIMLNQFYGDFADWAKDAGITIVLQRNKLKENLKLSGFYVIHTNKGDAVRGLKPKINPFAS